MNYTEKGFEIDGKEYDIKEVIIGHKKFLQKTHNLVGITIARDGHRGFDGCYESFICSTTDKDRLLKLITGMEVNFGEIAGKHSEIYGTVDEGDITIVEDTSTFSVGYDHSFLSTIKDQMEDSLYGYDDSEVDAEFEEEHKMTKADAKWLIEFCGKHI